jgi:hypothetical protein
VKRVNLIRFAFIQGNKIVLRFKMKVSAIGLRRKRFSAWLNGTPIDVVSKPKVRNNGVKLVMVLSSSAQEDDVLTLSYSDPKGNQKKGVIQDLKGRDQKSFSGLVARNRTVPDVITKERESLVRKSLLPSWMSPDHWNRRQGQGFRITGEGSITNASNAGKIGKGGNYLETGAGAALFLLQRGGANIPQTAGSPGSRYLSFTTNLRGSDVDRSEYTPTHYGFKSSGFYKFGQSYNIGFDLRIPKGSEITNNFYYLMQWWQGAGLPPIAGIRMKPGTSHTLEFIERSTQKTSSNGLAVPDIITEYNLQPDQWHQINIGYNLDPSKSGFFDVSVNGSSIGRFNGQIGSSKSGTVKGLDKPPKNYRVKFGIYKASEPSIFSVDYDNIVLS